METTFEKAKVGDRVWDIFKKWGTINQTCGGYGNVYGLGVTFDENPKHSKQFNSRGCMECSHRTLFWDELKFPERPKRKIKKEIDVFINDYSNAEESLIYSAHATAERAKKHALSKAKNICVPAKLIFEIEE